VIAALAGQGYDVKRCCRLLGVAPSSYFGWRSRPPSMLELRREWLRELIRQIHADSRGVYGYRRVRAELRLGRQIVVSRKLVHKLMAEARLQGLPTRKQRRSLVNVATSADLVCRNFARDAPNQLWLTDITEHPTREGQGLLLRRSRRPFAPRRRLVNRQPSGVVPGDERARDGDQQPHPAGWDGDP
jgi:putative transposase